MIRTFTLICTLSALSSGMFLYYKKHETLLVNKNIVNIIKETHHVQEQTTILRTEWALLNQPDRLNVLSARFLPHLHSINPTQFVRLAKLVKVLPPIAKDAQNANHTHAVSIANNSTEPQNNQLETSLALLSLEEKPSHHKNLFHGKASTHIQNNGTIQVASNNHTPGTSFTHIEKQTHHPHLTQDVHDFSE